MIYFFIGNDGEKYGPYDMKTLEEYIKEGRILSSSTLVDEAGTYYEAKDILPHMFKDSKDSDYIFIELKGKKKPNFDEDLSDISIELEGHNNNKNKKKKESKGNADGNEPSPYSPSPSPSSSSSSYSYSRSSQNSSVSRRDSSEDGFHNDSGEGNTARLPQELEGLNWGAYFLPLFWCMAHNVIWGVFIRGSFFAFLYLFKGNEMAWQNRRFESIDEFKEIQKKWFFWGLGIQLFTIAAWIIFIIFIVFYLKGMFDFSLKDIIKGYNMAYE